MDRRKLGAVAGVVGSLTFIATVTIEGWLRPGYDARTMFVSELALGPRGFVGILNCVAAGVATFFFARGMRAEFPAANAATRTLEVAGIGLVGAGLCVIDPLSTPTSQMSWHGLGHGIFGVSFFYGTSIACLLFARRFVESPHWRSLAGYSRATGIVTLVVGIATRLSLGLDHTTRPSWGGVTQRTHHFLYFIWQAGVAARLASADRHHAAPSPPG